MRAGSQFTPLAVGAYITAGYWFTASTAFANPAVTLARAFTNTFSGIRLTDVPGFIAAQCAGVFVATLLFRWFWREPAIEPSQAIDSASVEEELLTHGK